MISMGEGWSGVAVTSWGEGWSDNVMEAGPE